MAAAETHRTVPRASTLLLPPCAAWPLASMHRALGPAAHTRGREGKGVCRSRCRVRVCAPLTTRRRGARDLCLSPPLPSGADSAPLSQRSMAAERCALHPPRRRVSSPTTVPHASAQAARGGPWASCFAVGLSRHTYKVRALTRWTAPAAPCELASVLPPPWPPLLRRL
jgi:hypothetical protein